MTPRYPTALTLTERVLRSFTVLNIMYGTGILVLLIASLVAPVVVMSALVGKPLDSAGAMIRGMRLLMAVGLAGVPIAHLILARLRAMVLTVRAGDPFVAENARRLNEIAVAVLALEVLHLAVGAIVKGEAFVSPGTHVDWSFSFTPWISVLLLFVLARVFEHGARMRVDLEGTV